MLYELSAVQVRNLQGIIADATIKGASAAVIVDLQVALQRPVNAGVAKSPESKPLPTTEQESIEKNTGRTRKKGV